MIANQSQLSAIGTATYRYLQRIKFTYPPFDVVRCRSACDNEVDAMLDGRLATAVYPVIMRGCMVALRQESKHLIIGDHNLRNQGPAGDG